jgi:hypothetical protein
MTDLVRIKEVLEDMYGYYYEEDSLAVYDIPANKSVLCPSSAMAYDEGADYE